MTFLDLRREQSPSGPEGACKLDRGKVVMRDPASVTTLVGHQTACSFGVAPYMIQAAKGDRELARHRRALNVHAHVTAFNDGTFAAAYPLLAYVFHGNASNAYSVGLETEGHYNGIPGGVLEEPTDLTIETSRAACTWIVEEAAKLGATLKFYEAHRQHAAARRSDPGHRLWQAVYIDHCEAKLELAPRPDFTTRDGRPIPNRWDRRQSDGY